MPTAGDVFRITMCAELFSQDVCNIFYYTVALWTGAVTLEDVLDEFIPSVVDNVKFMQSTAVIYDSLSITDAMDPSVFFEKPYTETGDNAGTPSLPSYAAFGYKLVRTDRTTRNGYKRFAGVPEGAVTGNDILTPTHADYVAIETALAADLEVTGSIGGSALLVPAIVRMSPLDPYQVSEVNLITAAILNPYITTQNSRKVGRGS